MSGRVYVLIDPRDRSEKYIGETSKSLERRLVSHINTAFDDRISDASGNDVRLWIRELIMNGLAPLILSLQEISETDDPRADKQRRLVIEKIFIEDRRARGIQLFNRTSSGAKISAALKKHYSDPKNVQRNSERVRARYKKPGELAKLDKAREIRWAKHREKQK